MGWPKGTPRKTDTRKSIETMGYEPEKEPEKIEVKQAVPQRIETPTVPSANTVTFAHDTTIYHNEQEPKDLKAGDPVPDGWTNKPATLKVSWKNKPDGSWIRTVI